MRSRSMMGGSAAVIAGLAIAVAGCGNSSEGGSGASGGGSSKSGGTTTLNIGVIDSATGLTATAGRADICGAYVAQDAINAGAVPGVKVKLTVKDDQSTPAVAARAATALTSQGIKLFAGGAQSATVLAEMPIIDDAGGLATGGTSKADEYLSSGKLVVRVNSNNTQDAHAVANYINDTVKPKSLAIVAAQGDFGEGAVKQLKTLIPAAKTKITTTMVSPTATNYQSVISKINSQKPDAVLLIVFGATQPVAFVREYKQAQISAKLIAYPAVIGGAIAKAAGGAADGVVTTDIYATFLDTPGNTALKAAYDKYNGAHQECTGSLDRQAALTYAQVLLLAQAAAKAKSSDPATIRKTIIGGTWELPEGSVTFDQQGQSKADYKLLMAKGDQMVAAPGS